MKRRNIIYWIFTLLLVPALGIGSVLEVLGDKGTIAIVTELGYPAYLVPFLGIARLLALVAIILPFFPRLKEWAYAGLVFDVVLAMYSHLALHNAFVELIFPLLVLCFILTSYFLSPYLYRPNSNS